MKQLYLQLKSLLEGGRSAVLVCVRAAAGSTPRGVGAEMLLWSGGRCGTIGGGALEYEAEGIALAALESGVSCTRSFNLANAPTAALGMVCGGETTLEFQFLHPGDAGSFALIDAALAAIAASGCVYIFGAGHVARALVPVLSMVEFRCIVLDDRSEFADAALFPEAEQVVLCDFSDVAQSIAITGRDYGVIMTRGHVFDAQVQAQLMRTSARYIGVMGSASKRAYVRESMRKLGFSETEIERVKTPIGININSDTPAEIAVSIAAELIMVRAAAGGSAPG